MAKQADVLDYDKDSVREAILRTFKQRRGEAAPADIVAFTGLPKPQVDAELPAVADEFGGRLKVTESGEILYSFPDGYRSRYRGFGPSLKKALKAFRKGSAAVATFLFKAWIMVMLVGYFALFIALAVLAVLASVAGTASDSRGKSRSRGGGLGLTARLIDLFVRIWFYNEVFKSPGQRRYESGARGRSRENRRPLHKAIFSFVFGEPDPNADHDAVEKRAFVALARAKKGVILLEDFMAVTGLSPDAADRAINRYLYEFEGSPEVSEAGTVYYRFPKLLLRSRADDEGAADSPLKRVRAFSANDKKANFWYAAINGVNLAFGSYFLYCSLGVEALAQRPVTGGTYLFWFVAQLLSQVSANPLAIMTIGLGIVPLAFSALFWLVPALRSGRVAAENERIREGNMRRALYAEAVASPASVGAVDVASLPAAARPKNSAAGRRALEELAAYEGGDPAEGGAWRLPELERKVADAERVRASVRSEDYRLGGVAFDSGS
ncbi:MAG: hypothetical protein KKA67_09240 [Spirochaetes bacterium]|nr:hypothetical protein [Spirochaetota bacterium]MBU1081396.1 hypothetical protein [Spirochaetota bacterium]